MTIERPADVPTASPVLAESVCLAQSKQVVSDVAIPFIIDKTLLSYSNEFISVGISNMFKQLNNATAQPVVWSTYTAEVLWADPHIARQMMAFHLNPDINAASRSFDFIDESVSWLTSSFGLNQSSTVIDFGCGPGL
ncbi:hypothetical protein [Endozoicomonas acroporae]|uniref:hypothetical protein n=1 Tax=Endozoicomonas acroporae TaxID=1701104 RepID=UPI0019D5F1EE|nr:hypothetical protein [Endozoicomonas acroporae]